tara:strand:- start:632 stop:1102 length:471 start_codon:yes stop_codon:yes gene_type:complete
MKREEFSKWLKTLKEDIGEGYFIASISDTTCYFFYSYRDNKIDILMSSNSISVQAMKYQIEKQGSSITKVNNSENDMILDKYNSYLESSLDIHFDYRQGFYKVKQHQLEPVSDWCFKAQTTGVFQYFNKEKIKNSKNYKYDEARIENSPRKRIKLR